MAIDGAELTAAQPTRSTADVLAGRIRITLAGRQFVLPVLTIGQNEEWQAGLDAELQPLLVESTSYDEVVRRMAVFSGQLLDLIYSYDISGVLPERGAWEKDIYPNELLLAVMEVRLAADPTLGYAVAALNEDLASTLMTPARTPRGSGSRPSTAGRSRRRAS